MKKEESRSFQHIMKYKDILHRLILESVRNRSRLKVLDIGCAYGEDIKKVCKNGDFVCFAIDIDKKESWPSSANDRIHFVQADAESLPFKRNSFDIIIASEVIEHLNADREFLKEVHSLLKMGGNFFISTPPRYNYPSLIGKFIPKMFKNGLRRLIYPNHKKMSGIKEITSDGLIIREHVREYLPSELLEIFKENKFQILGIYQGFLNIPACLLFDKYPLLIKIWEYFDFAISQLPFAINFKANFIISARKPEKEELVEADNILVINLGGIGDILLSLPALFALRKLYPKSKFSCLVALKAFSFVEYLKIFDEVNIFYSVKGSQDVRNLTRDIKTLLSLRKKNIDLAINMRTMGSWLGAQKIRFLFFLIRPKVKCGRDTESWGTFFDIKIPEKLKGEKFEMEYDIDTAIALGASVFERKIQLDVAEISLTQLNNILKEAGILHDNKIIVFHIGGKPSRRWPLRNFAKLLSGFDEFDSLKFILLGNEEELDQGNALISLANKHVVNLCGKLTIENSIALIKRAVLVVANDSSIMHIAASVKTPLIALIGPGEIIRFDPRYIFPQAEVMYKKVKCAPCEKVFCKKMECLKNISIEEVKEAMERILGSNLRK